MSPEPPLQRADSDVSRQSDSPQPHTPTSTSPSTPSCSSRKTAQVDNVNSHVAHLNKYFEVHDHEDWCEKDFTKWCKKSNNPKFAKGQTVRCYWLNSLKNLAKEGSERAKELLAKSRTKTTEKRKSNDTATTTTTIRHKISGRKSGLRNEVTVVVVSTFNVFIVIRTSPAVATK
ncbi:hypothetical protein BDZ91DRAFT_508753 [Kalaharituber pfeilii]|nr:hypothetical protein BDZ91DRAFT_508753 [Kalaharituber pfeilii]